jgi:hypothetical protein
MAATTPTTARMTLRRIDDMADLSSRCELGFTGPRALLRSGGTVRLTEFCPIASRWSVVFTFRIRTWPYADTWDRMGPEGSIHQSCPVT